MAHTMSKVEADLEATEPSARVTNEPMPALLLEDESGSVVRLAELQGKVVILSFENEQSSSNRCLSGEGPVMKAKALASEIPGLADQLRFVMVTVDTHGSSIVRCEYEESEPAKVFLQYRHVHDEAAGSQLATILGFDANQTSGTIVIDPTGRVRARFQGSKFQPTPLMMFVAAVAHGEHPAPVDEHISFSHERLAVQLVFGGALALVGTAGYVFLLRRRAKKRNSEQDKQ